MHFFIPDLIKEAILTGLLLRENLELQVKDLTEWKTPSGNMKDSKLPKCTFTVSFPMLGSWAAGGLVGNLWNLRRKTARTYVLIPDFSGTDRICIPELFHIAKFSNFY